MFQAIKLTPDFGLEYLPDGRPTIRGYGIVVPSVIGGKYALHWKKMSREEGIELMKKYPPYAEYFKEQRFVQERREPVLVVDIESQWRSHPYIYLDGPIVIPTGPYPPQPICLWLPVGNEAWLKERIDKIVDRWLGSETAKNSKEWVEQCGVRMEKSRFAFNVNGWYTWSHRIMTELVNRDGDYLPQRMFELEEERRLETLGYPLTAVLPLENYPSPSYTLIGNGPTVRHYREMREISELLRYSSKPRATIAFYEYQKHQARNVLAMR